MTILGVRNKSCYLHFLLNLAVVLFNVGRETKRTSPMGGTNLETQARTSRQAPQPLYAEAKRGSVPGAAGELAPQGQRSQKHLSAIAGDTVCWLAHG